MPFGLTEPLFVPEYWMPPSLFDLALNTDFDIESLIFYFGIGGIGAVFDNVISREKQHLQPPVVRSLLSVLALFPPIYSFFPDAAG